MYVGHKLCYFGSIKIMGAYCVCRLHNMLHVLMSTDSLLQLRLYETLGSLKQ